MRAIILTFLLYLAVSAFDLLKLFKDKKNKEIVIYFSIISLAMTVSAIIILNAVDIPSLATFYKKIFEYLFLR